MTAYMKDRVYFTVRNAKNTSDMHTFVGSDWSGPTQYSAARWYENDGR